MKKKRNLYIVVLVCFITLVGVTIAYLQSTDVFENIFNAGTYSVMTHEEFTSPDNWAPGNTTNKTITTKNEGTIPVRVRVKLEENWISKNGNPLDLTFKKYIDVSKVKTENVSIINFANQEDWLYKNGYYYYLYELAPGETTSSLIESVTFNPYYSGVFCSYNSTTNSNECTTGEFSYMGGQYKLDITIEAVQADRYREVWDSYLIMYDYVGDNPCTYNGELVEGAEYVNGQYTYQYRKEWNWDSDLSAVWVDIVDFGWGVKLTDLESTDPVTTTLCSSINNKPIVSMSEMFSYSDATSIDLSSFDTSNVANMSGMFLGSQATTLDLSSFNTSKVTNMSAMFGDSQATTIDLSSFDTSNVTNMSGMFEGSHATTLDLSSFDTSNVTDMGFMFRYSQATSLDLSSFDTSNVTSMSYMFSSSQATSLDLSSFDTSNVNYMDSMFWNSQATSLDLSSFDTSNVINMSNMFKNAVTTTGYARTQGDADRLNASSNKPSALTFVVKGS